MLHFVLESTIKIPNQSIIGVSLPSYRLFRECAYPAEKSAGVRVRAKKREADPLGLCRRIRNHGRMNLNQ